MDLTDEQWQVVESILSADPVRDDGRGAFMSDRRKVLNGVLWILRTAFIALQHSAQPKCYEKFSPYSEDRPSQALIEIRPRTEVQCFLILKNIVTKGRPSRFRCGARPLRWK